jgi:CDP-diacylglycerol--serine O-phosphatidyltransferase
MANLFPIPLPPRELRLRRGIYLLPNLFTLSSLFLGFYSLLNSLIGEYERAAWAVLGGALFDAFDGAVARLTRTQSHFGQELDSLADAVTFGVAPGILMYSWALEPFGKLGISAGFFYVACTVLRLARFNLQAGTVERKTFQGLPSPGGAGAIATLVLFYYYLGGQGHPSRFYLFLFLCFGIALLMISNFSYPSTKRLHFARTRPFFALVGISLGIALLVAEPVFVLFLGFYGYIIYGILSSIPSLFLGKKQRVDSLPLAKKE